MAEVGGDVHRHASAGDVVQGPVEVPREGAKP